LAKNVILPALILLCAVATAQTVRNPKLSADDLSTAQTLTREEAGENGELVYATRIDAINQRSYDCLIVIYARVVNGQKETFALIRQTTPGGPKKYRLAVDQAKSSGRVLPVGDRYLRMGLRHEAGTTPILRLMSATREDKESEERQRNLDFQFDGAQFKLIGETITSLAR
jgi:hypothetical protein